MTAPQPDFEQQLDRILDSTKSLPWGQKEAYARIMLAHNAAVARAVREELKWIQRFPNGIMVIPHPDKDAIEVEYHAVPTSQIVKRLAALEGEQK